MTIFDFKNYKLFIVGDIHGGFKSFFNNVLKGVTTDKEIKRRSRVDYNNSVIVVLGDVGLGFESLNYYDTLFPKYNETLAKTNTFVLFIRGNHDDPSYYSERKINYSNIIAVPDYSILITKDYNSLCIGGGISADRTWRMKRETIVNKYKPNKEHHKHFYWSNEPMVYDETQLKNVETSGIVINSVLTHIPLVNVITMKNIEWARVDPTLEKDLNEEQNTIKHICENIIKNNKLVFWANGHIHNQNVTKNKEYDFLLISLNCNHGINDVKQMVDMNYVDVKAFTSILKDKLVYKDLNDIELPRFERKVNHTLVEPLNEKEEEPFDFEMELDDAVNTINQNETINEVQEYLENELREQINLNVQRRLTNNTIYGSGETIFDYNNTNLGKSVYELKDVEDYPFYIAGDNDNANKQAANNTVATNNIF